MKEQKKAKVLVQEVGGPTTKTGKKEVKRIFMSGVSRCNGTRGKAGQAGGAVRERCEGIEVKTKGF